jgi:hypothetical protein
MFRWYRGPDQCYVYLSDVPVRNENDYQTKRVWKSVEGKAGRFLGRTTQFRNNNNKQSEQTREWAFRNSRWFTRGWTLQELIAPSTVQFFSWTGEYLGSKDKLQQLIHEITGIPIAALCGASLSEFGVDERLRWAANRKTQKEEDNAYCLLGIFNVFMPLIYGQGENAFHRLKQNIDGSSRAKIDEATRNTNPALWTKVSEQCHVHYNTSLHMLAQYEIQQRKECSPNSGCSYRW